MYPVSNHKADIPLADLLAARDELLSRLSKDMPLTAKAIAEYNLIVATLQDLNDIITVKSSFN